MSELTRCILCNVFCCFPLFFLSLLLTQPVHKFDSHEGYIINKTGWSTKFFFLRESKRVFLSNFQHRNQHFSSGFSSKSVFNINLVVLFHLALELSVHILFNC